MFPTPSYSNNPGYQNQEPNRDRTPFSHSYAQPFSVAGMTSQAASHSPSLRASTLSGTNTGSLAMGDSLSQSRVNYQPGYLMSVTQNNNTSQGGQRYDEPPIVPTKAKMHSILSGSTASDFGMGSMFESSRERQRQPLADEDAPPTNSVNDIVNEVYNDSGPSRRQMQSVAFDSPSRSLFRPAQSQTPTTPRPSSAQSTSKPLQVIVFGYPLDKYSVTVEYFRSLGDSTEPDQNTEISNCFKIGYTNPADALRAVRKNGDVIGGSWMVGAKWADPTQAELVLGPSLVRGSLQFGTPETLPSNADVPMSVSPPSSRGFASDNAMTGVQRTSGASTPTVGTPIRLAPSSSAFKKPGPGAKPTTKASSSSMPTMIGGLPGQTPTPNALNPSPNKGVLGTVSDMIFGW
ncbi:hypothetical protein NLI96_g5340 [Meripilus lineatus]|uniref:RRM Nup35-type domain-containing protein n=1 Tax=Meripilus lineatus TaxID=2056292 RepID=A0AAD5V4X2_9APHY|nr:hypothetical protein NLI96_g5340 [Physisporinus lineatus]